MALSHFSHEVPWSLEGLSLFSPQVSLALARLSHFSLLNVAYIDQYSVVLGVLRDLR